MDDKESGRFDERTRILEMVADGRLKAGDASRLLEALQASESAASEAHTGSARWLRIRVYQLDTGKAKVSVNVPLALADMAMRFIPAETFSGSGVDPRTIIDRKSVV